MQPFINKTFLDKTLCDLCQKCDKLFDQILMLWLSLPSSSTENSSFPVSLITGVGALLEFWRKLLPKPVEFTLDDDDGCFELDIVSTSSLYVFVYSSLYYDTCNSMIYSCTPGIFAHFCCRISIHLFAIVKRLGVFFCHLNCDR